MGEELKILKERHVWDLVKLPANTEPIGCRWVYTIKQNEKNEIVRYKARLVAQGYKQVRYETYDLTFSPVVNFSLVRFFFSLLVSFLKWTHLQFDVKCAYLYADITENIFMKQPPGFIQSDKPHLVCKLNKALYGLHQSGRVWFMEINKVLTDIGFKKLEWCNCVYTLKSKIVLLLYVDDIVIFGKNKSIIEDSIKNISKFFDLKALGKTRKLLGVEFEEKDGIFIHQKSYIEDVYDRFNEYHIPLTSLPIAKGTVFSKSQCPQTNPEVNEMLQYPYRSLLGCLSFITSRTRPDINYAVNIFSQFQSNPGFIHWSGLLKLLGYVNHTKDLKLKLSCTNLKLITYTDADFAANKDDRTSIGGQIVLLGNSPITWRTFKEKCISLSTMEAEFVALTEAAKELLWFDRIVDECISLKIISNKKQRSVLYVDLSLIHISEPTRRS